MAEARERPLSPHLTIWRWGAHMVVSILHRITGAGLVLIGLPILTWWLVSAAGSAEAYSDFSDLASSWIGIVVLLGLTWAFFQKVFAGLRHLLMDTGMGYELRANKAGAIATIVASVIATAAVWAWFLGVAS